MSVAPHGFAKPRLFYPHNCSKPMQHPGCECVCVCVRAHVCVPHVYPCVMFVSCVPACRSKADLFSTLYHIAGTSEKIIKGGRDKSTKGSTIRPPATPQRGDGWVKGHVGGLGRIFCISGYCEPPACARAPLGEGVLFTWILGGHGLGCG